jgi:hypothetical protein
MRMQSMIKLTLALAGTAFVGPAGAETLRCGSALIQPGDDARYVLEQCGEPVALALTSDPTLESGITVYHIGSMRADRWRYHRGPGLFPVIVTIGDDGRVADIRFERVRD